VFDAGWMRGKEAPLTEDDESRPVRLTGQAWTFQLLLFLLQPKGAARQRCRERRTSMFSLIVLAFLLVLYFLIGLAKGLQTPPPRNALGFIRLVPN